MQEQIIIREATKDDHPLIFDSWLKDFGENSEFAKLIPYDIYNHGQHKVIRDIFKKPKTCVLVVALKEDPQVIVSFIVFEPKIIHWVHTKGRFRKFGIAKFIIETLQIDPNVCQFTHRSHDVNWIQKKFPGLKYNPYILIGGSV